MAETNGTSSDDEPKVFAGRFEYQKPLGKGAGGAVYLAEDLHNDRRRVALKVLSAEACESVQGKMLRREFEILSKLDHPNLVRVYDYGAMRDGGVYLAEEYIDGFSLQDARALMESEAHIDVTRQVLLGLAYLHGMGMIHRDVKPANIMLLWVDETSIRPLVKLVDFGLSSMDPGRDTLRGGTRSYMAPEVIRGNKGEFRSDLFSLGVSLYYALCGVLPFGPRSKKDPPPTEEPIDPPPPHRFNADVPLTLSRFTMVLLRQVDGLSYEDAGEALQALARDTERRERWSGTAVGKTRDVAAPPVLRGYFERGILGRRVGERERLVEVLSGEAPEKSGQAEEVEAGAEPSVEVEESGHGSFVLVRGGPEVGKTRLLSDVAAALKIERCRVVRVDCTEQMQPWELVHEVLDRIVELGASRDYRDIAYYKSYLLILKRLTALESDESHGEGVSVDPEWLRRAFHEAVTTFEPARLVVVIDDFHCADPESRELLVDCYESADDFEMPATLATARPREMSAVETNLEALTVFDIEGMTRSDLHRFFEGRLGIEDVSESWLDTVEELAGGQPGYLEEVCRTLIDERLLHRRSVASWNLDREELDGFDLPESIRASFRRRFASIGASGREALEVLSLYERPVRWEALRRFIESNHDSAEEADQTLQALCQRYLARMHIEVDGRYLELVDPILGEVVRDLMSPSWEAGLHRRIAERLREGWERGRIEPSELARHLEAAGDEEGASRMWEAAGDGKWRESEFDEAHGAYAAALEAMDSGPSRAYVLSKQAKALLALYETEACRETIDRAWELSERTGLDWVVNSVCLTGAELGLIQGQDEHVEQWLSRLTDCLPSAGEQAPALELRAALARRSGDFDRADDLLDKAMRRVDHFGQRERLPGILVERADLADWRGETGSADTLYDRAVEEVEELDEPVESAEIAARRGFALRRRREFRRASELLDDALEVLSRGDRPDLWIATLSEMALCRSALEDPSGARRHASDALVFARAFGDDMLLHRVRFTRAELDLEAADDPADALERMEDALHAMEAGNAVVPELLEMTARYREAVDGHSGETDADLVDGVDERARDIGADHLVERLQPVGE